MKARGHRAQNKEGHVTRTRICAGSLLSILLSTDHYVHVKITLETRERTTPKE